MNMFILEDECIHLRHKLLEEVSLLVIKCTVSFFILQLDHTGPNPAVDEDSGKRGGDVHGQRAQDQHASLWLRLLQ